MLPVNVRKTLDLGLRTVLIDCGIVGPGALAYAAPERFQGKIADEKSDLFSLGLLLYRWIAGEDLITADGYEQFAEQMASVQDLNISEKLYATGAFETPEGAQQLSALEPLWSGLFCADISERVEDFDELDEILEIALDKVSHGEVALAGLRYPIYPSPLIARMAKRMRYKRFQTPSKRGFRLLFARKING